MVYGGVSKKRRRNSHHRNIECAKQKFPTCRLALLAGLMALPPSAYTAYTTSSSPCYSSYLKLVYNTRIYNIHTTHIHMIDRVGGRKWTDTVHFARLNFGFLAGGQCPAFIFCFLRGLSTFSIAALLFSQMFSAVHWPNVVVFILFWVAFQSFVAWTLLLANCPHVIVSWTGSSLLSAHITRW